MPALGPALRDLRVGKMLGSMDCSDSSPCRSKNLIVEDETGVDQAPRSSPLLQLHGLGVTSS
jgi:hypothetical protein